MSVLDADWWFSVAVPGFFIIPIKDAKLNCAFSRIDDIGMEFFVEQMRRTGHKDADWFLSLFPNGIEDDDKIARLERKKLLLSQPEDGGRSLYFASLFCDDDDEEKRLLRRSMSMGYVRSYGGMVRVGRVDLDFLYEGAKLNDDVCCHELSIRLEPGAKRAIYIEKGARLGNIECMYGYSRSMAEQGLKNRVDWLWSIFCIYSYGDCVEWYKRALEVTEPETLFYIGEISKYLLLQFRIRRVKGITKGIGYVEVYHAKVIRDVRCECITWILCAKEMGFNKDVRKMISKKLWLSRFEGRDYE